MANFPLPVKNVAYILYTGLIQQADTRLLKAAPTLAAGDFKVSIDGGAFANLATLPTVTPAAGVAVKISLSAAEMNGDNIIVTCIDAAGAEWSDQLINIQTATRGVDDLAFPATSGRSLVVDAAGLADANVVKVGPTGAGAAQTAGDIMADTNDIQTRLPAALVAGRMDSSVGAMAAAVITAAAHAAGAIDANALAADIINDIWAGTALTEAYAADGAAATPAQLLYLILALLSEFATSGTTLTAKKLDGVTTAATFTLSDATNPTSITRAT